MKPYLKFIGALLLTLLPGGGIVVCLYLLWKLLRRNKQNEPRHSKHSS